MPFMDELVRRGVVRRIRRAPRWGHLVCGVASMGCILLGAAVAAGQTDAAQAAEEAESLVRIVWENMGWIGGVILALSLAAVTVIIEHFWTIRRSTMVPEEEIRINRELIENRRFKECIDSVGRSPTMFADVLTVGLRHGRHGFDAMLEAVEERAGAWRSRLFRKVEYLNIIGNMTPLLGLLGTVLGMIEAFGTMKATQGNYGPVQLAGGISLALTSTFMGLVVAIVALGFFGICRNRVDSMTVASHAAVVDLLEYFRPATVPVAPAANVVRAEPRPEPAKVN